VAGLTISVLLTLVLTACGGGSGGSGGGGGGGQAGGRSSLPASVVAQINKVTSCLRAQGVQVPSPAKRKAIRQEIQGLPSSKQSSVLAACGQEITALRNVARSNKGG